MKPLSVLERSSLPDLRLRFARDSLPALQFVDFLEQQVAGVLGDVRRLLGALARLDLAEKKPDDAKIRIDKVLTLAPDNVEALLLRASMLEQADSLWEAAQKAVAAAKR